MAQRSPSTVDIDCGVRVLWIARFDYSRQRRLAAHRHQDYQQIFHVLAGRAWFRIGEEEIHAPAGTTVRVPANTVHAMRVISRDPVRTLDCKFRITNSSLSDWLDSVPLAPDIAPERARDLLQRIREIAGSQHPQRQALCDSLMATLTLELPYTRMHITSPLDQGPSTSATPDGEALPEPTEAVLVGLRHWLEEHHAEAIDAPAIARAMGYSYRHIAGLCQAAFACTPTQLLQRIRVGVAQRLLLIDDRHTGHILCQVGFANPAHGNRVFTRICGTTPALWRKQQRELIGRGTTLDPDFTDSDWIRPA
ncbi:MAG: AraC family transcriptional regulator [Planctomycetota bacterium]|nr:MAG: AraC family transcriptional regulator [Planctomycetota bacterium]